MLRKEESPPSLRHKWTALIKRGANYKYTESTRNLIKEWLNLDMYSCKNCT